MEPILTRNTPNSETPALLDQRVYYFVRISWNHFFFSMLLITRTEETSLSVEVNMSTFHTWDERPLWIIVPTARTRVSLVGGRHMAAANLHADYHLVRFRQNHGT